MHETSTVETVAASGPRYLSIQRVCDKFSRRKSWLFDKIKNDPTFPKSKRLGAWQVFIESELDEWFERQASAPPARKPHENFRREKTSSPAETAA